MLEHETWSQQFTLAITNRTKIAEEYEVCASDDSVGNNEKKRCKRGKIIQLTTPYTMLPQLQPPNGNENHAQCS